MNFCYFNLRTAHWFEEKNANETIVCFFWCYFTIVLDFLRKTERKICHKFTWARRHHFRQRAQLNPQWRQYRKIAWCFLHFFCETAKCQNQYQNIFFTVIWLKQNSHKKSEFKRVSEQTPLLFLKPIKWLLCRFND